MKPNNAPQSLTEATAPVRKSGSPAVTFTVHGKPSPSGSKKAFRHSKTGKIVVVDTAKGKVKWQTISKRSAATAAKASGWVCATGPVELQVEFCFARPKSHYGTGKRSNILKPSAPLCHIQKPDRTKLLRCIEDAFKGVLWKDDSQVISGAVSKRWGKEDCATVTAKIAEARC